MNIFFVSLGCDKNLVDSEYMLGMIRDAGYTIIDDETQADVIVINTCCFINRTCKGIDCNRVPCPALPE